MGYLQQGDVLKIEHIKYPVLVVSKDFFNTSGAIIGCPIISDSMAGPLHIWTSLENAEGYIQCEKLALLDLSVRGYKKVDSLPIAEMINVSDAIQGIFEYI
mgnify:CR=1 FL=1